MTGSETSSAGPVVSPGAGARVRRQRQRAAGQVAGLRDDAARGGAARGARRRRLVRASCSWTPATGERELSSGYRRPGARGAAAGDPPQPARGQEGASESRRVAESGEPILASDVRAAIDETIDGAPARARRAPGAEVVHDRAAGGARARARVDDAALDPRRAPLRASPTSRSPRRWPQRCALAIDNARLHDAAERSLSLLDTVFSTAPVGPRARRPRPALRARQRDVRRLQRPPGRGARRARGRRGAGRGRPRRARRSSRATAQVLSTGEARARPRADRASRAAAGGRATGTRRSRR